MSQGTKNNSGLWLSPSNALSRFEAKESLIFNTVSTNEWQLRFGIRIGDLCILIEPESTSEVIEKAPIYSIPNTPQCLLGLINLRGNLVPTFDLHEIFSITRNVSKKQMILVLDEGAEAVAMLIDGLPESIDKATRLKRLPPLPQILQDHSHEAYLKDGIVWLEFQHKNFFKSLTKRFST